MEEKKKKMGRPTDDPLEIEVKVRINTATSQRLNDYGKRHNMTRAAVIRKSIIELLDK